MERVIDPLEALRNEHRRIMRNQAPDADEVKAKALSAYQSALSEAECFGCLGSCDSYFRRSDGLKVDMDGWIETNVPDVTTVRSYLTKVTPGCDFCAQKLLGKNSVFALKAKIDNVRASLFKRRFVPRIQKLALAQEMKKLELQQQEVLDAHPALAQFYDRLYPIHRRDVTADQVLKVLAADPPGGSRR